MSVRAAGRPPGIRGLLPAAGGQQPVRMLGQDRLRRPPDLRQPVRQLGLGGGDEERRAQVGVDRLHRGRHAGPVAAQPGCFGTGGGDRCEVLQLAQLHGQLPCLLQQLIAAGLAEPHPDQRLYRQRGAAMVRTTALQRDRRRMLRHLPFSSGELESRQLYL